MVTEIPQIRIHLASNEEPTIAEPPSPYAWAGFELQDSPDGAHRPQYLSPPPSTSPRFVRQASPLGPSQSFSKGQGLEQSQFQALLKSCRERNNVSKKPQDLRREVAIKVHQSKQLERRALFLSKVAQPPSPSAISTPKTPPESPSIFYCSLPSPGLVSPLAHYETLSTDLETPLSSGRKTWVEQVDYRLPTKQARRRSGIPSLEEISARLNAQREQERAQVVFPTMPVLILEGPEQVTQQQTTRLPAFLQQTRRASAPATSEMPPTRQRLSIGNVGRLHMPVRPVAAVPVPQHEPPKTPTPPELEVTTTIVPFTASASPVALSEYNLMAMNSRERCSVDMLNCLKRRSVQTTNDIGTRPNSDGGVNSDKPANTGSLGRAARWKRHSAPADFRPFSHDSHPVLSIPGGF